MKINWREIRCAAFGFWLACAVIVILYICGAVPFAVRLPAMLAMLAAVSVGNIGVVMEGRDSPLPPGPVPAVAAAPELRIVVNRQPSHWPDGRRKQCPDISSWPIMPTNGEQMFFEDSAFPEVVEAVVYVNATTIELFLGERQDMDLPTWRRLAEHP